MKRARGIAIRDKIRVWVVSGEEVVRSVRRAVSFSGPRVFCLCMTVAPALVVYKYIEDGALTATV